MSKPKAPAPPDPTATANAQTQSNVATAGANQILGNTNQVTPYGNVNYSYTPGPGGINQATQTTTLSPEQQHLYDLQTQQSGALGQLGIDQTNHVADILGSNYTPAHLDVNGATGGPLDINGQLGDPSGDVEARTRELLDRGVGHYADLARESQQSTLANQGINIGTDAWGEAKRSLENGIGDAYAGNELQARQQAGADRQSQLAEILGQRSTNLGDAQTQNQATNSEMLAARENPLAEISALAGGNQLTPINPGAPNSPTMAGTDVAGITQSSYANRLAAWQQQMQSQTALMNGLAQLGGSAIAGVPSDPRLKRDVEYSHTDSDGLRWWRYRYLWDADDAPLHTGVMATEAPPHAVSIGGSGFLMVDYGQL